MLPTEMQIWDSKGKPEEPNASNINKTIDKYSFNNTDPFLSSNCFSKFIFYWSYRPMKISKISTLQPHHMGVLQGENSCSNYFHKTIASYEKYKAYPKNFILKTIWSANIFPLISIIIFNLISTGLNIGAIYLFREYMKQFRAEEKQKNNNINIYIGVGTIIINFLQLVWSKHWDNYQSYYAYKWSAELNCLIFDKILKAKPSANENSTKNSQIINYIQNDSNKLTQAIFICPNALCLPILIIAYSIMLFLFLGWNFIFGFVVLGIFLGFNFCLYKKLANTQKERQKSWDKRLKITSSTWFNIKILKLYGWDLWFLGKIFTSRNLELSWVKRIFRITNGIRSLWWFSPIATSITTWGTYQYFTDVFRIEDVFTCLGIFSSIQEPIRNIANVYTSIIEMVVSLQRIEKYWKQEDVDPSRIISNVSESKDYAISIENMNFYYDTTKILSNISLKVHPKSLCMILGDVGSGKSSLLQAILNNMSYDKDSSGQIEINGNIAYVSQSHWIQNATIKQNILFNSEYNEEKYNEIVKLCELESDFNMLIQGDMTEIGEKGINLSGGQKARVSIARAVYADKDIYLFDDPISALDANVGMNIMKNLISGYWKEKGKTVILVTHAEQFLKQSDMIAYLQNGEIGCSGTFEEVMQCNCWKNSKFTRDTTNVKEEKPEEINNDDIKNEEAVAKPIESNAEKEVKRITKDEDRVIGNLSFSIYSNYMTLIGGKCLTIPWLWIIIIWQGLRGGSDIWLAYWSNNPELDPLYFFLIYASLGIGASIFTYLRWILISHGSWLASKSLHQSMLNNWIKAPINLFHDTIPRGIILNRWSKDWCTVDFMTSVMFGNILAFGTTFLSAIIICSIYQPYCLIFLPILGVAGLYVMRFYWQTSRELTRWEGTVRTPIVNIVNEVTEGSSIIRAYNCEQIFTKHFRFAIDENWKVNMFLNGTSIWFSMVWDWLSFSFKAFLIIFTLIYKNNFRPEIIGILFTYSLQLQENIVRFLQCFSAFENCWISVERCQAFTKIESEMEVVPKESSKWIVLPENWPSSGKVTLSDYSVKYRPDTEVILKHLNLTIHPGEKVGVCGRTGSGKSTLTLCLFRILEALNGKIEIDDIDISQVPLNKIRSSLTIIPQDPSWLDGSLLFNIDPTLTVEEDLVRKVLTQLGCDWDLNMEIVDEGKNLSVGEKQWICIIRAIVRKSKIIVMDEATASIDYNTEEIIQKVINEMMRESTVITIAHRIKTILNYDKIVVMDEGNIVEVGNPKELLENTNSIFYGFYKASV